MGKQIILDGQILHGSDRYGLWRTHIVTGWDQTPAEKSNDTAREGADGDYDTQVHYGPRLITLNGRLNAINAEQAAEAKRRLTGLIRQRGQLLIDDGMTPLWATVKRGNIVPGNIRGNYLTWQAELRAPDPRKFGEARIFNGSQAAPTVVHHRGNYDATPRFTVTGNMPGGYTIQISGESFIVTWPLLAGHPHTIDYRDGRLRVNGELRPTGVSFANIRLIPPARREEVTITPITTGTAALRVDLFDTYI